MIYLLKFLTVIPQSLDRTPGMHTMWDFVKLGGRECLVVTNIINPNQDHLLAPALFVEKQLTGAWDEYVMLNMGLGCITPILMKKTLPDFMPPTEVRL